MIGLTVAFGDFVAELGGEEPAEKKQHDQEKREERQHGDGGGHVDCSEPDQQQIDTLAVALEAGTWERRKIQRLRSPRLRRCFVGWTKRRSRCSLGGSGTVS